MASHLTIKNGYILDPANGTFGTRALQIKGDGIAAVAPDLPVEGEVIDAAGCYISPGFIDLHTHVYAGGTSLGIDPDRYMANAGVTTSVDTGSAGPGNFPGFRDHVIGQARARILALLHVSFAGIFGFDRRIHVGESEDLRLMAPVDAVAMARANPDTICGIKVRVGRHASGIHGTKPLDIALQVADETGLPLMAHIDEPPPTYSEVLERLRPGDILTHAFRPFPNAPIDGKDQPLPALLNARARGIRFDIGHGMGSFSFEIAEKMLAAGFAPDVISSDVHALCIDGPAFDLPTTMTKFLALGVPLETVVQMVTEAPALAIRRPDLGNLAPDAPADLTLFRLADTPITLEDATGATRKFDRRIEIARVIRAGKTV